MDADNRVVTITVLEGGRGVEWIRQAWELFKRNPGIWIGIVVVWAVAGALLGMIPMVGMLTNLFTPVVMGGVMLACRRQDQGGEVSLDALIEGFRSPMLSKLVLIGVLSLVGSAVIGIFVGGSLMMAFGGGLMMGGGYHSGLWPGLGIASILGLLLGALLVVPLTMALWFAPALVVFRQMEPVDAIKASFEGCLKNVWSLTVYSLVALAALIVGSIPALLGLLVALPVLLISIYCSYKEIYGQ